MLSLLQRPRTAAISALRWSDLPCGYRPDSAAWGRVEVRTNLPTIRA